MGSIRLTPMCELVSGATQVVPVDTAYACWWPSPTCLFYPQDGPHFL
jgi:hypothetical protein